MKDSLKIALLLVVIAVVIGAGLIYMVSANKPSGTIQTEPQQMKSGARGKKA